MKSARVGLERLYAGNDRSRTTINKQRPILLFVILALMATAPFTNAQAQQLSEEQLAKMLKRFPEADTDADGKLTTEEIQQFRQSRQRNKRPAAAAQPLVVPDHVTLEKDIVYLVAGDYEVALDIAIRKDYKTMNVSNPNLIHVCTPLSAGTWTTPDGRLLIEAYGCPSCLCTR